FSRECQHEVMASLELENDAGAGMILNERPPPDRAEVTH
ncbi:MAG: hypothetical protein H6Q48_2731, partial [Deltaproteobacteria bacterium]|nr:hypothetical protein [Deltaproteobacteria bacterium]